MISRPIGQVPAISTDWSSKSTRVMDLFESTGDFSRQEKEVEDVILEGLGDTENTERAADDGYSRGDGNTRLDADFHRSLRSDWLNTLPKRYVLMVY